MEVITINLDVTADWKVSWGDEVVVLVHVLILSSLEEWTFDDTGVLLGRFEDGDGVIGEVERDDESSVNIFGNLGVESGGVSQYLLVVVHVLEEVDLGLLWNEVIHVTKGVDLVSETVVSWHLYNNCISWFWLFDVTQWHVSVEPREVIVLRKFIYAFIFEDSTVSDKFSFEFNLIASEISVTNELLTWLIDGESLWQFLSSQVHTEGVSSVIWEMNFSDLNGVVSQEVVPDKLKVFARGEESEHLSVIIQELFDLSYSSST